MIRRNDDECLFWYDKVMAFSKSNMRIVDWVSENNLDFKLFNNMVFRILWKSRTDKALYATILPKLKDAKKSGFSLDEYCRQNKITGKDKNLLREGLAHLAYVENIERIKLQRKETTMKFLCITPATDSYFNQQIQPEKEIQPSVQSELIKKQNDIEISIAGVKVSLAPHLSNEKIINIIKVLKDL